MSGLLEGKTAIVTGAGGSIGFAITMLMAENGADIFGNPERRERIMQIHQENVDTGKRCPELIIIDSTGKNSASVF